MGFRSCAPQKEEACASGNLQCGGVIEHEDGSQVTVAPGDSFVIPYGAHTIWRVEGYVRKSFICHFMENDGPAA